MKPTTSNPACVAFMRTRVGSTDSFVVNGTLPSPAGIKLIAGTNSPVFLRHPDGTPLPTQLEIVARRSGWGVAVAEVIALAHRGQLEPGSEAIFEVCLGEGPQPSVAAMFPFAPGYAAGVTLHGQDANPKEADQTLRAHRGICEMPIMATVEGNGTLDGAQTSLWMTARAGSRAVEVDVLVHNGSASAPRAALEFERFELTLPTGWIAQKRIASRSDVAGAQVLPPRHEFHERYVIAPAEGVQELQDILDDRGFAICVAGTLANGAESISWRHEQHGSLYGMDWPAPDLAHVHDAMHLRTVTAHANLVLSTSSGSPMTNDKNASDAEGWWHPLGVPYGGQTGGDGIEQWPGLDLLELGSCAALGVLRTRLRGIVCRQRAALYMDDGLPVDGLAANNLAADPQFAFDNGFTKLDPFGFSVLPKPEGNAAAKILSYAPIDGQHLVRATSHAKALVWLANDPLARRFLHMQAEWCLMTYGPAERNGTRLQQLLEHVNANPRAGARIGRGEGWAIECVCMAYATLGDEFRARAQPWLYTWVHILRDAQTAMGFWQAQPDGKICQEIHLQTGDTSLACGQAIELGILAHAARMLGVQLGVDALQVAVEDATNGMLENIWPTTQKGPHQKFATARKEKNGSWLPIWDIEFTPSMTYSDYGGDAFQVPGMLTYSMALAAPQVDAMLGLQPSDDWGAKLHAIESQGLANIENRAPLLAELQGIVRVAS